jgi:thiosulfate/3-mercaptopyruvate sulfurtransferase
VATGTLVAAGQLAAELAGPDAPVVLDCRWSLASGADREGYERGHLPGAVFVDLDRELSAPPVGREGPGDRRGGPPVNRGRHPLPDPGAFQAAMRRAGVGGDRPVVAYDQGEPGGAARPGGRPLLDAAGAARLAAAGVLLDARAPARYQGLEEPVDPVAGHIPGAVNLPMANLLTDRGLVPPAALRRQLATAGTRQGTPVGAYCGSGVVAAHVVLALEAAGVPAALYAGSWSDWVTDPARPVATGPRP